MITENTIGPFSVFFTNLNRQMNLAGHSHFAQVRLTYRAGGGDRPLGFPSFEDTHAQVQQELRDFFERPFHDHTNEDIARRLFERFNGWTCGAVQKRTGVPPEHPFQPFQLVAIELAVRGVPDRIGHADSFTVYTVRPDSYTVRP